MTSHLLTVTLAYTSGPPALFALSNGGMLAVVILAMVLFWAILYVIDKLRKTTGADAKTPRDLFWDLCRVHRLTRQQRTLLAEAASHSRPEEMARIFVDPTLLKRYALAPSPNAEAYRTLHRKLFGDRM